MRFGVIIPDRGDRPQLLKHCFWQLSRMTLKPDMIYLIDDPPTGEGKDLIKRVKKGVELAKADGIDKVYIIENDDYYREDYFELMDFGDAHFIGAATTIYYHLPRRRYEYLQHKGRASLCHTGFRISALDNFRWPSDHVVFLDINLWNYSRRINKKSKFVSNIVGVGIKHNFGLLGGRGHRGNLKMSDPDFKILETLVDEPSFNFYKSLY